MPVFATVAAAIGLALGIKAFCDSLPIDSGDERLLLQIKNDSNVLEAFAEMFRSASESSVFSESEMILLDQICTALKPLLEDLNRWIEKKSRLQDPATTQRTKTLEKAWDKISSTMWRNADKRKLADELTAWTERYHIRIALLPPSMQTKLYSNHKPDQNSLPSKSVADLQEFFKSLTFSDASPLSVDLVYPEADLNAPQDRSRVIGHFQSDHKVIVEYKSYPETMAHDTVNLELMKTSVKRLAEVLKRADPYLCRIPKGRGYVHEHQKFRFALLYELPPSLPSDETPRTLWNCIVATRPSRNDPSRQEPQPPSHSLDERFDLARRITTAVLYVNAMGWVHKSIRTRNIVLAPSGAGDGKHATQRLGDPYLCGFDMARQDKASSDQKGDAYFEFNIYRHPARQGLQPEERYTMNHDIYSLGVVLLELGLWRPLIRQSQIRNLSTSEDPSSIKAALLGLAGVLPIVMGKRYYELVEFCLNINGETAVAAGTAVEEILSKLEDMSRALSSSS